MESLTVNEFGWQPPVLTTARLVVRPFTSADVEPLFHIASNPNVTRHTLWSTHRTIDDSHNFVESYAKGNYLQHVPEPLAITMMSDVAKPIGSVGCFWVSREHRSMELGFWISEGNWGQGFAGEAARTLLDHVFAEFPVERIQAHCVVPNGASARVIEKLGFQFEGVARRAVCLRGTFFDVNRYAILKEEWKG